MKIIILAGGNGTRLWPLSRKKLPKQFLKIFDKNEHSLFQKTLKRSLLLTNIENVFFVINKEHLGLTEHSIKEIGIPYINENIIVEPEGKNTLPAIFSAVKLIYEKQKKDENIIVFPSDHIISNEKVFIDQIKLAEKAAENYFITFGILPTEPNVGYGYISPGEKNGNGFDVKEFKEKPDKKKALEYINNGYYWNSGILLFNSLIFLNEVKLLEPDLYKAFFYSKNIEESYQKIAKKISIDYGILEKSNKVLVFPLSVYWNDMGSYEQIFLYSDKDEINNLINCENYCIDTKNNLININEAKLVVSIGIEDLILIETEDVLFLCRKGESYKSKEIISFLNKEKPNYL